MNACPQPPRFHQGTRRPRARLLARSARRWRRSSRAAARQPRQQPHARCLDPHQRRRQRDRVHRQGGARAGHPHGARADRGRRARPAARARQIDLRRHRPHAERGHDRRQPVGREPGTALRLAGAEVRAHPARACRGTARDERGFAQRRGRRDQRGERPQGHLCASLPAAARSQARGDRNGAPKPSACTRSSASRSRASTFPARSPAGDATCRTLRLPAWCTAGWCARRATARRSSVDDSKVEGDAGRDRGGARRLVPRRDRRTRGAGRQGARGARRRRRNGRPGRSCRTRRSIFEHLKSLPTKVEVIGVKQAPLLGQRAEGASRRPTPSPTWRMPRSARRRRSPNSRTAS